MNDMPLNTDLLWQYASFPCEWTLVCEIFPDPELGTWTRNHGMFGVVRNYALGALGCAINYMSISGGFGYHIFI